MDTGTSSIVYKEAATAVIPKYIALDTAVKAAPFYTPVSTTYFEPSTAAEKYHFFETLELSVPIVVVKEAVGGSIGNLTWLIGRRPDVPVQEDLAEVADARSLIAGLIPTYHSRAQRRIFQDKLRMLCTISTGAANALYKELTGDESSAESVGTISGGTVDLACFLLLIPQI